MIVDEIQNTMLDLPLTFFFLMFIYFFVRYLSSKGSNLLYLSAISLGLMAGVKSPFFIPMFTLVSAIFIIKVGQLKKVPTFLVFIFIGYVIAYFCYFIKHPNPIPWIRLHQKIYDFLKNNGTSHDPINVFRYIFTSEFRGFWVGAKSYWPTNWSLILPLGLFSSIFGFFQFLKKKSLPDWFLFFITIITLYLLMNLLMDFWPRYLVPLTPLLILTSYYLLKRYRFLTAIILLTYIPYLYLFLFPQSTEFINSFHSLYQSNFYKDTYQLLDSQSKQQINLSQWQQYSTSHPYSDQKLHLVKESNQWRIKVE